MQMNHDINLWLTSSLFFLGVLLLFLGLAFLIIPEKILRYAERLNHWIKTEHYFEAINRPIYKERIIYRYHHIFGILIMVITSGSIYMMVFYMDITILLDKLSLMVETAFAKWLLPLLYYILIGANILAFIIGAVILIRPSMLKTLEEKANHWISTEEKLKALDNTRELPESIFPGNPRIFGVLIILGAIYMIWNTFPLLMW